MTSDKQLIIGLGTGRCGTTSLSKLLSHQRDCSGNHESRPLLPWHGEMGYKRDQTERLLDSKLELLSFPTLSKFKFDIGHYYLSYVELILEKVPTAKFVCLFRPIHEVVLSFAYWTCHKNHWQKHNGFHWQKDEYDVTFPKFCPKNYGLSPYSLQMEKLDVITQYCEMYEEWSENIQEEYPDNFRIFPTDYLNMKEGVNDILTFCGFGNPVHYMIHENKGAPACTQN